MVAVILQRKKKRREKKRYFYRYKKEEGKEEISILIQILADSIKGSYTNQAVKMESGTLSPLNNLLLF